MDAFHPTSALPMGSRSNPCATGKVRVPQAGSRYRSWYEQVRHAQHRLASALACPGRDSMRVMYPSYLGNNQRLMSIAPGRVGRLASACRHLPAVVPSLSTHTPWVGDGEPLTHTTSRSLRSNSQEWGQSNAAKELGHQRAKLAMLAGCPRLAGTGTRRQDHGMADCDASRPLARSSVARTSVSPGSLSPIAERGVLFCVVLYGYKRHAMPPAEVQYKGVVLRRAPSISHCIQVRALPACASPSISARLGHTSGQELRSRACSNAPLA
ncbi:hypothetical protein ACCO45_001078 [Purpureocillium lilacinum]|uniref:Uncharacterized protein n=1 Tax=Purpureocillium lilacinum TaxID=33203 RepID=A0ACC4E7F8_PURLI